MRFGRDDARPEVSAVPSHERAWRPAVQMNTRSRLQSACNDERITDAAPTAPPVGRIVPAGETTEAHRKRLAFWSIFGTILATVSGRHRIPGLLLHAVLAGARPQSAAAGAGAPSRRALQAPAVDGRRRQFVGHSRPGEDGRRAGGTRRAVFVGDSFVELRFTPLSVPAAVHSAWARPTAGSRPRLSPSPPPIRAATTIAFATWRWSSIPTPSCCSSMRATISWRPTRATAVAAPHRRFPGGSLLGFLMPRTNWPLVNRLDLSAFFRSRSKARPTTKRSSGPPLLRPPKNG